MNCPNSKLSISQKMLCQAVWQGYESFCGSINGWHTAHYQYLTEWTGRDFESVLPHIFAGRDAGLITMTRYGADKLTKSGEVIMRETK